MAQQNDSKVSDPDAQSASDPMTTQSGLDSAAKDASADAASGYGTRSRNRNSSSRINYAEDRDIDADVYDYYHDKKDGDSKKTSRQSSAAVNSDAPPRGGASSRKAVIDEPSKPAQPANVPKEQQSGSSNSSSTTTQPPAASSQPTRKRKVASSSAGSTNQATSTTTSNTTKKAMTSGTAAGISWPETNMLTFENSKGQPVDGQMIADDGTVLEPNDHVYLVCEPPGEPYYLGRIMEFLHVQNDNSRPVEAIRINWYYRPKDIGRKSTDTRMVFATMHSDISPLTALRGKCQIHHKAEIPNMDAYRKTSDSFWYDKLYDRYIQKNYDLIPTRSIVNVPANVKKVLDERWKYVLVEQGRGKELTSAVKLCKRCTGYCASNDSVDCAVCQNTYHMNCVNPPLLKKPSRGFAWSCAACSRAQERKLEARNTPNVNDPTLDADDDEPMDEEDDEMQGVDTSRTSPEEGDHAPHEGTAEQIYQASLWPYRYLGMHCKPEDALDYDDRIHPRAATRIGPRNQATVLPWPGQPVEYVKPLEFKKNGKKDTKSKEALAAIEAEKISRGNRPKWVQDMPPGYTVRGEDYDEDDPNCTAKPMWIPPSEDVIKEKDINQYMEKAKAMAKDLGLPERSTNLQDVAADTLFHTGFDTKRALKALPEKEKVEFREPELTPAEQKKFEEAVIKYGSELYLVRKHVKSMYYGMVTRYYYAWKKSERGMQVLENMAGRKGKKEAKRAEAAANKMADDVADNDDDSAFDAEKANQKKRGFVCQFCSTTSSRQWRRAPNPTSGLVNDGGSKNSNKDKGQERVVALCRRCAELWRRYAIRWEDMEEVAKKVAQSGGRAWKRKQDEELLKELQAAKEMGMMTPERAPTPSAVPAAVANVQEPPRKKLKSVPLDKDVDNGHSDTASAAGSTTSKKKDKDKSVERVTVPEMPKPRVLPCAVCGELEPRGDQHLSCRECRLTVHRNCYGIMDNRNPGKWTCDMCVNDKNPQVSIHYKCILCPHEYTEHDFVEQPKLTHHKKKMSEKDRERERLEVQQARKAADFYRKKQEDMNRPVNPREPLKRTADNNWVHVTCAVWTPEVKFGNAKALEPSEGIPSIPRARYNETCKICDKVEGACVSCHQCRTPLHVECARQQGHILGFEISPVKGSRRDQVNVVTVNGESGTMSATVWCKEHAPTKTTIHHMHDIVDDSGLNALQLYVQNFKQADLTLTGTARKANLMTNAAKLTGTATQPGLRRSSTTTLPTSHQHNGDTGAAALDPRQPGGKVCITCGIDVSPKWYPIDNSQERELTNGHYGTLGSEAQKFVEQRRFQCHQCRKDQLAAKAHPPPRQSPAMPDAPPPLAQEAAISATAAPPLRSPPQMIAQREAHAAAYAWPPHGHTQTGTPAMQAPALVADHALGARPPAPHAYAAPPPHRPAYSDWGRPASQQSSPSRHINGGPPPPPPPPIHNAPPMSNLSSLRPPPVVGPVPPPPPPANHHGGHPSSPYTNGLPLSPRQLNGPAPPSRYAHPYQHHGRPVPPAHLPPNMANGAPPPPPPPPRGEGYPHEINPQRPPYTPQTSPPGSRNGHPPPQNRPASGASASPSLRNLLS